MSLSKFELNSTYGCVAVRMKYGIYYKCLRQGCLEEIELFSTRKQMINEYKKLKEAYKKESLPLSIFRFKIIRKKEEKSMFDFRKRRKKR